MCPHLETEILLQQPDYVPEIYEWVKSELTCCAECGIILKEKWHSSTDGVNYKLMRTK